MIVSRPPLAGGSWALLLLAAPLAAQPAVEAATRALAGNRPWQATLLLRPVLADQTRTSADVILLAARAAAAWQGWSEVDRLLAGTAGWDDPERAAEARDLLARAALARQANREAADHLRVAAGLGAAPRTRGVRHALLGRAFDRLDQRDSAAVHYLAAAALLPEVADWLLLRAAGIAADSAERARHYRRLDLPAAQARIPWTEAAALERTGDHRAAAARYELLGAATQAARARLRDSLSATERTALRRRLVELLTPRLNPSDTRAIIALLDQSFTPLGATEQLAVARRAAAVGERERAVRGFAAARNVAEFTDADRLAWGTVLAQLGRHAEAIPLLATVGDPTVAGAAAYQRARSLLSRSGASAALPALRRIAGEWPDDSASAGVALYLAGDLLADQGDWEAARASFLRVAREYPSTRYAARGWLESGTIAYALGRFGDAHAAFATVAERYPEREEGSAGTYWAGRVEAERGDTAAARARWRSLIARVPHSYYALAAARRLGEPTWAPTGSASAIAVPPETHAALIRAALLDDLGMATERQFELDHLLATADGSVDRLLTVAQALHDHGRVALAVTLAQRALARGAERTPALYRLLFPVPHELVFHEATARQTLDPWFVAGLIKQESGFEPRARSAADARGLMQVLPSVGGQIARQLGWTGWDPVLLYQPEVSLTLGTRHLQAMQRRYPDPVRVLAAYNAGATRVARWENRPGVRDDPELFLEMIPYLETRNYVRRVLRNAEFYRALYGGGEQ